MSYVVLARKWRPQSFDDLIGQDYITQTLKNAISTGKIAHAFIFSGPRGVGKTSTARIVAKALNCAQGPTSEPCSKCTFCTEISEGKSLDVMEIDAASHTGVNDVREIIENIKYLPTSGKYKIYIIDEAHMLSQSAFNALLKTLEEPPAHVLFILATTEVHKIPVTILSRCQRYDFKKVTVDKIVEQLVSITSKEKIKVENETLYVIAQEADGSLRDSLSLMDQLIATFGSEIKHEEALSVLGILDRNLIRMSLQGIVNKDPKFCISVLGQAVDKGISPRRFAEDLLRTLRNALLIKTCGKDHIAELSEEDKTSLDEIIKDVSVETLESLFNLMLEGAENIQRSFYPQMSLELVLIKLATLDDIVPLQEIINKLDNLGADGKTPGKPRRGLDESARSYKASPKTTPAPKQAKRQAQVKPSSDIDQIESESKEINTNNASGKSSDEFIQYVKSNKPVIGRRLEQAKEILINNSHIKIVCELDSAPSDYLKRKETQNTLGSLIKDFFSEDLRLQIEEVKLENSLNKTEKSAQKAEKKEKIKNDPLLKDALDVFGGRVISIKPNNKE